MKCEEYRILVEDFVEGALDHKAALRVTSHTAACVECASFYQEMSREQEIYARYQRDVEVTPVLWASIESRIKEERVAQPEGQLGGPLGGMISRLREQFAGVFSAPRLSPAFAAALMIVAIGTTVFVMSRLNSRGPEKQVAISNSNASVRPPDASNQNAGVPVPAPNAPEGGKDDSLAANQETASPNTVKVAASAANPRNQQSATLTPAQLVRDAEQKYLKAIAMLSRDVNRRRSQLDPMMLARFDASLSEIDRTIKDTRHVVRANPEDPIALQYLLAAYSKKVDVLREMTTD
jgi:anti-sigma factor RsiW